MNVLNSLNFTFKKLILCYVNYVSILKGGKSDHLKVAFRIKSEHYVNVYVSRKTDRQ